jgi:HEPN domain-containing protein
MPWGTSLMVFDTTKTTSYYLYDGLEIPNPQIIEPKQRRELSILYFEKFFDKASAFQTNFEFNYQNNRLQLAICNLHQTCGYLFATYLTVHIQYRSRTHDLYKLRSEVKKFDRHIEMIFPTKLDADKKDYGFFSSAYVDARYLLEYHVDQDRLDKLTQWTANFQNWVYGQSIYLINAILPEQPYTNDYTLKYRLLDLDTLKNQPLPEAALAVSEQELEREKTLKEKERSEKEAALKREAELRQRLKDAGLE